MTLFANVRLPRYANPYLGDELMSANDLIALTWHPTRNDYCRAHSLSFRLIPYEHPSFRQVLELRTAAYRSLRLSEPDGLDSYSEHYLAFMDQAPVATMRVTRKSSGPIECEEYFPQALLKAKAHQICSATRFAATPSVQASTKTAVILTEVVRLHQASMGIRLDVINVHERAVRYYGKMGYELVANSHFVHPTLGTPSYIMVLPVTPNRDSPTVHIFEGVTDTLEISELEQFIQLTPWKSFQSKAINVARVSVSN